MKIRKFNSTTLYKILQTISEEDYVIALFEARDAWLVGAEHSCQHGTKIYENEDNPDINQVILELNDRIYRIEGNFVSMEHGI